MTTFKVNPLSCASVTKALQYVENYKRSLKKDFLSKLSAALTLKLNEYLESEVPPEAVGMWEIHYVHGDGSASSVFIFDGEVEFVEFGTGVIGKYNHEGINEEWLNKLPPPYYEYNKGNIDKTKARIVHHENESLDYWWYYDSGFVKTQGVPADPFIYRSVTQLREHFGEIAKEVFIKNNIGKDVEIWS